MVAPDGSRHDAAVRSEVEMTRTTMHATKRARAGAHRKLIDRRSFLRRVGGAAAGAIAAPWIVPASVFGGDGVLPPSERITLGCIGVGRQSTGVDMPGLMNRGAQVVAVCDVDSWRRENAKRIVDNFNARRSGGGDYRGCDGYGDFRDLCARDDLDAVLICTPDPWHVPCALEAVRRGKDVYLEKPMSFSIHEGRVLLDGAVQTEQGLIG